MASNSPPLSSPSWSPAGVTPALAESSTSSSPHGERGPSGTAVDQVDRAGRLLTPGNATASRALVQGSGLAATQPPHVGAAAHSRGSPSQTALLTPVPAITATLHGPLGLPADDMPERRHGNSSVVGSMWPPPPSWVSLGADAHGRDVTGSAPLLSTYPAVPHPTKAGLTSDSGHHQCTGPTDSTSSRLPSSSMPLHCRISPKLSELVRAAATREDEDAPFLNIPAELLLTSRSSAELASLPTTLSACGTTTMSMLHATTPAGAPTLVGAPNPLERAQRTDAGVVATHSATPTSTTMSWPSASFSAPRRVLSPSSTASTTAAAEALMVDPDAPRPRRQGVVSVVASGGGGGGCGSAAPVFMAGGCHDAFGLHDNAAPASLRLSTAVHSPITPLSVADGSSTVALSSVTQGSGVTSVVPTGAYLTAVPPMNSSPALSGSAAATATTTSASQRGGSESGSLLYRMQPPHSVSHPSPPPPLPTLSSTFAKPPPPSVHAVVAALNSASEAAHAGGGMPPVLLHQPASPLTPCGASHGLGGSRRGEHPFGLEGFAVCGHNPLDRRISIASSAAAAGGRSGIQLAQPVSTALLERVRKTASFASAQSTSGRTDAPFHFEDLLDAVTVSSVGEDEELTRDILESLGGGTATSPATAVGTDEPDTNDDTDAAYDYDFDEDADGSVSVLSPLQLRRRRRGTRRMPGTLAVPLPDGAVAAGVAGMSVAIATSSYSGTMSLGASPPLPLDADPPLPLRYSPPPDTEDDHASVTGSSHTRTPTTARHSSVSPSSTQLQVGLMPVSEGEAGEEEAGSHSGSRGSFGTGSDQPNAISAFGRFTIAAPPPPLLHLAHSRSVPYAGAFGKENSSGGAKGQSIDGAAEPAIPTPGDTACADELAASSRGTRQSPPPQGLHHPRLSTASANANANATDPSPFLRAVEGSASALDMPHFVSTCDSPFFAAGAAAPRDVRRTATRGAAEDAGAPLTPPSQLEGSGAVSAPSALAAAQQQQQQLRGVWARRVSRPPPLHLRQNSAGGPSTPVGRAARLVKVPSTACASTSESNSALDDSHEGDEVSGGLACISAADSVEPAPRRSFSAASADVADSAAGNGTSQPQHAHPPVPRHPASGPTPAPLGQRPPIAPVTPGPAVLPPPHPHHSSTGNSAKHTALATPTATGTAKQRRSLTTRPAAATEAGARQGQRPDATGPQTSWSLPAEKSETAYPATPPPADPAAAAGARAAAGGGGGGDGAAAAAASLPLQRPQLPRPLQEHAVHATPTLAFPAGRHATHRRRGAAGPPRKWSFYLLWILLPYGVIVVLLALATFVATHVVSQGIAANSLAERHTYVRSELVAFMEDVTLLPVMASETFTSSHIKEPARPRKEDYPLPSARQVTRSLCAAIKFTDLSNSMVTMAYIALRSLEPLDEVLYVPLNRGDRVDTDNIAAAATAAGRSVIITDDDGDVDKSELYVDARSGTHGMLRKLKLYARSEGNASELASNGTYAVATQPAVPEEHGGPRDAQHSKLSEDGVQRPSVAQLTREPPLGAEVQSAYAYCMLGHTVAFFAAGYMEAVYAGANAATPTSRYVTAIDPLTLNMTAPLFSLAKVPATWGGDDMAHISHVLPIVHAWKTAVARGDGSEARVPRWWISSEPYECPSVMYVHPFYEYGRSEPSLVLCRLEADALLRDFVEHDATRGNPSERPRVMLLSSRNRAADDASVKVDIIARSWTVDLEQAARRRRFTGRYRDADDESNESDAPSPAEGSDGPAGGPMRWVPWFYLGAAKSVPTLGDVGDELVQAALRVIDVHRYAAETHQRAQRLFGEDDGSYATGTDAAAAATASTNIADSTHISSTSPAARQYRLQLGDSRRTFMPTVFRQFLFHGQKVAVSMSAVHLSSNFTAMVVVVTPPAAPASRASRFRETALRYVAAWTVAGVAAAVTYLVYTALIRYLQLPLISIEQHLERVVELPPRTPHRHAGGVASSGGNAAAVASAVPTAASGTLRTRRVSASTIGRSGRQDSGQCPTLSVTSPSGALHSIHCTRQRQRSGGADASTSSTSLASSCSSDSDAPAFSRTVHLAGEADRATSSSKRSRLSTATRDGAGGAAEGEAQPPSQRQPGRGDPATEDAAGEAPRAPAGPAPALPADSGAALPSFPSVSTAGPSRVRGALSDVWRYAEAVPRRITRYFMRMRLTEVAELQDMCRELRHHVRELRQYIPESYDLDGSISGNLMDFSGSPLTHPAALMPLASSSTSSARASEAAVAGMGASASFARSEGSSEVQGAARAHDLMSLASQSVFSTTPNASASRWIRRIHRTSGYMPGEASPASGAAGAGPAADSEEAAVAAAAMVLSRSGNGANALAASSARHAASATTSPPWVALSASQRLSRSLNSGVAVSGSTPPRSSDAGAGAAGTDGARVVAEGEAAPLDVRAGAAAGEGGGFTRLLSRASVTLRAVAAAASVATTTKDSASHSASASTSATAAHAVAAASAHEERHHSNTSSGTTDATQHAAEAASRSSDGDSAAALSPPEVEATRVHHESRSSQSTATSCWDNPVSLLERFSPRVRGLRNARTHTSTTASSPPPPASSTGAADTAGDSAAAPPTSAAETNAALPAAARRQDPSRHRRRSRSVVAAAGAQGDAATGGRATEEHHREQRRKLTRGQRPNRFTKCLCSTLSIHVHVDRELKVVQHFPEILEVAVDAVRKYGGHFDLFVPEMLYASFGSRIRIKDHAVLATRCAVELFSRLSAASLFYCTFVVDTGVFNVGVCGVPEHQGFVLWGRQSSELLWEQQLFTGFRVLLTDSVVPLIRNHFRVAPVDVITIDIEHGKPNMVVYVLLPGPVTVPWWPAFSRMTHQAFLHLVRGNYEQAASMYDRLVEFPLVVFFMVYTSLFAHVLALQENKNGLLPAEVARQTDEQIVRWTGVLCREHSRVLMPFGVALPWMFTSAKRAWLPKSGSPNSSSDASLSTDSTPPVASGSPTGPTFGAAPLGTAVRAAAESPARSVLAGGVAGDSLWWAPMSKDPLKDADPSLTVSHAGLTGGSRDRPLPRISNATTSAGTTASETGDADESDDAEEEAEWLSGVRAVVLKTTFAGIALRVTDASGVSWQLANEPIGGDLAPPYVDSSRGFVAISSAGTMAEVQVFAVRESVDRDSIWSSSGVMSDRSHPRASLASTSGTDTTATASTAARASRGGTPQDAASPPLPARPPPPPPPTAPNEPVTLSSTAATRNTAASTATTAFAATASTTSGGTPRRAPRAGASVSANTSPPVSSRFQTTAMPPMTSLTLPHAALSSETARGRVARVVTPGPPATTLDVASASGPRLITPLSSDAATMHPSIATSTDALDPNRSMCASSMATPVTAGLGSSSHSVTGDGGNGGGGDGAAGHRSVLASSTTGTAMTHAGHGIDRVVAAAASNVDVAVMQDVPRRFCHGNIVQLISLAATATHVYTITEPLSGRTLQEMVNRFGSRVALATTRKFCVSLLRALEYLHVSRGIVHGRMQPDNVIFGVEGTCKLAGMRYLYEWARPDPLLHQLVTRRLAAYSAPEVNLGAAPTPASDIYSFGLLLLQMLTGRLPWSWAGTHEFSAVSESELSRVLQDNRLFVETLDSGVLELRQYGRSRNQYNSPGSPGQSGHGRPPHTRSTSSPVPAHGSAGMPCRHPETTSPSTFRHPPPPLPNLVDDMDEALEEDRAMLLVLESCLAPNPADRKSASRLLEMLSEM